MINRIICWFSCGITSAYATKSILEKYKDRYPIEIVYFDTGSEHPDNKRFLIDCEKWYNHAIKIIKHPEFKDIYAVYDKSGFIANRFGAKCSYELKKKQRERYENLETDLQIFGYDNSELNRANRFRKENPLVNVEFPLLDQNLSKANCILMINQIRIKLPEMYLLGYKNNNCIGCVKGAKGYWNKIRKDFPDVFEKMAQYEEKYGAKLNIININGIPTHISLRQLPITAGNYQSELPIVCGFSCGDSAQ